MAITPRSSWMSLADILAGVKLGVRESTISDANYTVYINQAYKFLFYDEKWDERITEDTITLVASQSEYELPVEADDVIVVKSGSVLLLPESEIAHHVEFGFLGQSGTSYRIRFRGVNIKVYPVPTSTEAGNELNISFYRELCRYDNTGAIQEGKLVNNTDYPLLHPSLHEVISLLAQVYAIENTREEAAALTLKIQRFKKEYNRAKYNIITRTKYPNKTRIFR